jgi:hypothetical protein
MNLRQIIKKTQGERMDNSKFVRFSNLKAGYDKQGFAYIYAKSWSTHHYNEEGRVVKNLDRYKYVTYIKFLDQKLNVDVSCSCADFMFRWEYALNKKGAAEIYYSNGQPAVTTNPKSIAAPCKHLIAMARTIQDKVPGLSKVF